MNDFQVVPDTSSTLGDPREHAETLVGNHMEICRMSGLDDPNCDPIVGELRRMYRSIVELNGVRPTNTSNAGQGAQTSNVDGGTEHVAAESGAV
jgi:hypothetical protein